MPSHVLHNAALVFRVAGIAQGLQHNLGIWEALATQLAVEEATIAANHFKRRRAASATIYGNRREFTFNSLSKFRELAKVSSGPTVLDVEGLVGHLLLA